MSPLVTVCTCQPFAESRGDEYMIADTTIFSQQHGIARQADAADIPPMSDAEAVPYTATLAAIADDETFCDDLLDWVRATRRLMPNPVPFEDPAVIARLCALPDHRFTPTLIALAKPDCLSLDILFDERLLPRLARMRRGHLRGTFLPYARQLAGFAEHDFMRELRHAQQALKTGAAALGSPIVVSMDTIQRTPVVWLWWP